MTLEGVGKLAPDPRKIESVEFSEPEGDALDRARYFQQATKAENVR